MLWIYGIKNCNTVKTALSMLDTQGIKYTFVNLKTQLPEKSVLQHWCDEVGIDSLVNKRGATWRKLSDEDKDKAQKNPVPYILKNPSLMKRPIIVHVDNTITVGFGASVQQKLQK